MVRGDWPTFVEHEVVLIFCTQRSEDNAEALGALLGRPASDVEWCWQFIATNGQLAPRHELLVAQVQIVRRRCARLHARVEYLETRPA